MLIAPSDHVIPDADAFQAAVVAASGAARGGDLITFGIKPDRAETGYGYLELAKGGDCDADAPQPLAGFVEKPDAARAADMLAAGHYLWNAGIFLCAARTLDQASNDFGFTRLAPAPWAQAEDISIDYAIMEKADNLQVMPFGAGWSDLGGWE